MKCPDITIEQSEYLLNNGYLLVTENIDKGIADFFNLEQNKRIKVERDKAELYDYNKPSRSWIFGVSYISLEQWKNLLYQTGFIKAKTAVEIAEEKHGLNEDHILMVGNKLS